VVAPVNLSKLVQEMSRLLESALSKNIQFDFDLTKDLPLVEADPTQMRQVVMNLMTNAAESMSESGGRVRIRTGTTKLDKKGIKALRWGGDLEPGIYAFIEISDTGCGMDEETLKRIFDPFFTTKFTGRGLGLAATLGIVRGHHGAIQVKSEEGRGTTFTLWFPIIKKPTPEILEPEPAPRDWRLKGKILVADDEETVRAVVERSLAKCGFEIIMAKDGEEALERFASENGSLSAILLDLSMPRRNGLEVLEEIRKVNTSIPVLVSSGYASEEFSDRFAAYGVSGFIQKPYIPAALVRKLEEILQGQKV
jgi:CheY-like chemotaxis protein